MTGDRERLETMGGSNKLKDVCSNTTLIKAKKYSNCEFGSKFILHLKPICIEGIQRAECIYREQIKY